MTTINESGKPPIESMDYWKNYLQDTPLQIPFCFLGEGDGTIFRSINFKLNPELQKKVEFFVSSGKYNISTLFTALWTTLVSRYADQDNIVMFSSDPYLPLKILMTKETSLSELITNITSQLDEGKGHPLLNIYPLIESQSLDSKSNTKSGIVAIREAINLSSEHQNIKPFDMLFEFVTKNTESFEIIFNDKFEEFYVKQMGDHFVSLLEGVMSNPLLSLYSIPITTPAENQRILFDFNKTDVNFREDVTLHQLFEEQVERTPDSIAVVYKDKSMTYCELNEKANRLGHAIRGHYRTIYKEDILPDTPIGICMDRGAGMVVAILGILKAGCAYMPIDPTYPADRLRFMMDDAHAPLVITEMVKLEKLLFLNETDYGVISLDGGLGVISKYSDKNPELINNSRNLSYIIYTSGSTGRPKGAMTEHRSVINYAFFDKKKRHVSQGTRILQFSSINFDMSVGDIFPALLFGATLYITPQELRMDPEALLDYLKEQSINNVFLTPAVLHAMPKEDLPSLKCIYVGGEICDRETLNFWSKGRILLNVYGPTEGTVISNGCNYTEMSLSTEIGGPNDNMKVYVLDKYLNPVPIGVPGELYIGGVGVCRGYLNRPELTAESFIKNPFITHEEKGEGKNLRLYKSGDRVRWLNNGSIDFLGRVDFQVKIRGFRIEPGEIEAVLSSHGEILECVVVAYDEGIEKRLVAYYVPMPGTSPAVTDLKAHLSEILPDYMIPSAFVELSELPLSPSGKIDRKQLPPPTLMLICAKDKTPVKYVVPQTPHEVLISEILCAIMNLEKISSDSDIFDMGVHSLMAAKIASEIRKKFSIKIDLKDIFEHRNIQSLAKFISEITVNEKAELISISRVLNRKNIPLSFQQEQIWFLSKLVPNNRAYNFQFSLSLEGKLDKNILVQFLNEMVIRHEILRTTFKESTHGPVQIVHAPWKVKLNEADLTNLPEDKRAEEAEKLMEKILSHAFDFSKLPLVSWSLFKISEEKHIFLHMEHHFLHDGWEAGIFLREMKAYYIATQEGKPSPLQELPIQYADYAIWQRNNLSGERLEEKISYWINKIKDYPTVLNLPTDHPRPSVQSFNGDAIRLNLNRSLYHSLREFSRNNKVTLFNTMYSAFAILISKYSRQSQFLIGTGVANRNLKETEGLMGMFVNTVLLYSDLSNNPTFKELLNKTKESMIYDATHYDIPFMHIVERLKAGVTPGRNPLFQVLFAFHDSDIPLLDFAGLHGELLERHNATAKVDMNVICIPRAEQHVATESAHLETEDLTIVWEYNSDIFKRETIEGMVEHYLTLLEEIIKSSEKNVGDVNILLQKEKEKIVFGFNDNAVNYDRSLTIIDTFEEQVNRHPDKVAIVHNGKKLTYQKLNAEANKLANRLNKIHQNSSPYIQNTCIGICMERCTDMMIGLLGILKSGCAYVPIPPNYPENRIRFIMEDSALNIILTQSNLLKKLPFLAEEGRMIISLDMETGDNADFSDKNPCNKISTEDIAYIIYTSGSTGNPKGVTIPQRAVTNFVTSIKTDIITENDIIAQSANYAFDATIYEFWATLLTGATIVIIDSNKVENFSLLKKEIFDNKITSAWFTASLFNAIVDCDLELLFPLKSVLFGGEAANVGCVKKLLEAKPHTLNVFNGYGPTECTCFSAYCFITDKYIDSDVIPIGKPLHNYTAYILDSKLNPTPIGVPGELYIGGDSLAIGYLNRPELTKERFIDNPFVSKEDKEKNRNTRLYKTGDLVRWMPDGNIEFLGRIDFQVKIRGFRIEPEEIEAVLLRHAEVKQCVVIPWNQYLIAYWVPRDNAAAQEDMKTFLARQLPEFMIPTAFIKMESFKLNSNFKVDRSKLPTPKLEEKLQRNNIN
jgi:amino acid adenylation domain-containing protein